MAVAVKNNIAIFSSAGKKLCVETDGRIIRVFEPGSIIDPLVRLDFRTVPIACDGDSIKIGRYTLSADASLALTVKDGDSVVYADYTGDATIYEDEKDFSLAALEGHKIVGTAVDFKTQINVALGKNDCIYGLGDKAAAIDRRGYKYEQWNTDDPSQHNESYKSLYKSINFCMVKGEGGYYGLFYPDPHRVVFDLGAYRPDFMYIGSQKGNYDYFIILGGTPREIVRAFSSMVGLPLLPRLKMLGYQQSRWSYSPQETVEQLVNSFVKYELPLDYVHLDIDYMDGYRVYTTDKSRFPDMKALSGRLAKSGVELVTILDPGVKYDTDYFVYKRFAEIGGLATRDGREYHNAVWPGESVYPDYFDKNAAALATELTSDFMAETGVTGIWCDMNEPASFNGPLPDDVMFGGYPHERVHNLYGDRMVRAVAAAFDARGERPFVITRACFATSSPYTVTWNGDNQSLWAHLRASLPQIATMNICGFPLNGVDVGGFGNECTKELLIRWIQAGIFSPLLRNHSSIHTRDQEPYAFDEEALDIYRRFLRLRYDMTPYLYDAAHLAHETGEPIIRPMFYAFPDDPACARISDQIMIGDSLMLAPVLDPGATHRTVYFPDGEWLPWAGINADGKKHRRGVAAVEMPLGSTGLYYRADSIIPMYKGLTNLGKKPDELIVRLGGGRASYVCREDDGRSTDGKSNVYEMTYDGKTFALFAAVRNYDTDYKTLTVVKEKKAVSVPFAYSLSIDI